MTKREKKGVGRGAFMGRRRRSKAMEAEIERPTKTPENMPVMNMRTWAEKKPKRNIRPFMKAMLE